MANEAHVTTGQMARQLGESPRRVREALVLMEACGVEIPRCGHYRYIPLALLPDIRAQIARMKRLQRVNPALALNAPAATESLS